MNKKSLALALAIVLGSLTIISLFVWACLTYGVIVFSITMILFFITIFTFVIYEGIEDERKRTERDAIVYHSEP